jgi:hypothetical protein
MRKLAAADIRLCLCVLNQVRDLLEEPLGGLVTCLRLVIARVERGESRQGHLHVGSRKLVNITGHLILVNSRLGQCY